MSVTNTKAKSVYNANGTTTEWNLGFTYDDTVSNVHIYIVDANDNETEVTSNYSIAEGVLTYPTTASGLDPLAEGNKLVIVRDTPRTQDIELTSNGKLDGKVLEGGYDKLTLQVQELTEQVNRAVKIPVTEDSADNFLDPITAITEAKKEALAEIAQATEPAETAKDTAVEKAQVATEQAAIATNAATSAKAAQAGAEQAEKKVSAQAEEMEGTIASWVKGVGAIHNAVIDLGTFDGNTSVTSSRVIEFDKAPIAVSLRFSDTNKKLWINGTNSTVGIEVVDDTHCNLFYSIASADFVGQNAVKGPFVVQAVIQYPLLNYAATEDILGAVKLATKAEAEAGTNDTKAMTPLKTKYAIEANATVKTLRNDVDDLGDQVSVIEGKIPQAASDSNQLADKAFVNAGLKTKQDTFTVGDGLQLTNKVLSLKAKELASGTDLNTITTEGRYFAGGSNNCLNKPAKVDAFGLVVIRTASGYYQQTCLPSNVLQNKVFVRTSANGTWSSWVEIGSGGTESDGIKGDYCTSYGILEAPNGILTNPSGMQVTLKQGVVLQLAGQDIKTTVSGDMTQTLTSTADCDLFYVSGTTSLMEVAQIVWSKNAPDNGQTGVLAWWNPDNKKWKFKSNDTGNVWAEAVATPVAHIHTDGTTITRIDHIGYRVMDDEIYALKSDVAVALNERADKQLTNTNMLTNCILSAPNGVMQVSSTDPYTLIVNKGLKVALANGYNADGTPKSEIVTLENDVSLTNPSTTNYNRPIHILLARSYADGSYYVLIPANINFAVVDTVPENIQTDKYLVFYNRKENLYYEHRTDGSLYTYKAALLGYGRLVGSKFTSIVPYKPIQLSLEGFGDYVIESQVNSDGSWYRKYKSGWLEQGGKLITGTGDYTFLKPYASLLNVTIQVMTTNNDGASNAGAWLLSPGPTNTGFQILSNFPPIYYNSGYWYAVGQGAN